ncbi:MAG: TetR/AcrR family transcriptional regulator [Actinomycetota bacterium]
MTEVAAEAIDGRAARRQRNVDAVLDVVIEMFAEEAMLPTMEQAAIRSGLSLRSLYRYFADPGELMAATIKRSDERHSPLVHLPAIGQGPLNGRIERFASARLRLHEVAGPVFRATVVNAARHPVIRDELARSRNRLREQFELQFAPELAKLKPADRQAALTAGDLLTQIDSIDYMRRHRQLSRAEAHAVLVEALGSLLG